MGCQVDFTSDSSLVCKKMGGRGVGGAPRACVL